MKVLCGVVWMTSENLCSLKGGTDRLAVSVVWTVDPENFFEIVDVWFGRTIIRSKHQVILMNSFAVYRIYPLNWTSALRSTLILLEI